MLNFFTEYFNFITYGVETLALVVGLFCFKKFKHTTTRIFIYYLAYVAFVDIFGATFFYWHNFPLTSFLRNLGVRSMSWFNSLWIYGSIIFALFYIYHVLKLKKNKTIIKYCALIFSILILGHFIIYTEIFETEHHPLYQFSGAFVILFSVAIYFIEFINSERIISAFKTFSFYALSALLIWWIIVTPILFFDVYNIETDWDFVSLKRRIFVFANIFMYSCFAIGLIISKPQLDND